MTGLRGLLLEQLCHHLCFFSTTVLIFQLPHRTALFYGSLSHRKRERIPRRKGAQSMAAHYAALRTKMRLDSLHLHTF